MYVSPRLQATVGFIVWSYIASLITEGSTVFINDGGYIRQVPGPLLTYMLRLELAFDHHFLPIDLRSWLITGGLAIMGWIFALLFFGRYRRRIVYWV
jgi:ABC-type polysaccharide/polyol phosphate export permease